MFWVALRFPSLSPVALEQIAAWACQFTPRVSLEPPRELLLEVEGSLRYFGGERSFLAKLRAGLADIGSDAVLATAPSARAALWRARGGGAKLEELPIEVACSGEDYEFLKSIGIATIGQVIELPRAGLARRCGPHLLDDIDCAF